MLCSIVINTYRRPESLERCLEALANQDNIAECEVVVVDDGGGGDAAAFEARWAAPLRLRYLNIEHAGRAAARNRGVAAAAGRRIIFLGDDIHVRPGWLEPHLRGAGEDANVAVIGPYPLDPAPPGGAPYPPAFARAAEPVPFEKIENPEDAGFIYFITGNLSIQRERFGELGGFDERFTEYGWEDIDLGYRFYRSGGRVVYRAEAAAIHAHPRFTRGDLWRREFAVGVTSYQFWTKYKTPDVEFMKFWDEDSRSGPAWRRALGGALIGAIESVAPGSPRLDALYERLCFSWRHAGVQEGRRRFGNSMDEGSAGAPVRGRQD